MKIKNPGLDDIPISLLNSLFDTGYQIKPIDSGKYRGMRIVFKKVESIDPYNLVILVQTFKNHGVIILCSTFHHSEFSCYLNIHQIEVALCLP